MNRKKTKYERCYCRRMPSGKYAWPKAATRQWLWPISGALSNSSECRTKQWNEQEQQKSCRIGWLSASIDSPGRFSRQHRARSINIYFSLFVVAPAQQQHNSTTFGCICNACIAQCIPTNTNVNQSPPLHSHAPGWSFRDLQINGTPFSVAI